MNNNSKKDKRKKEFSKINKRSKKTENAESNESNSEDLAESNESNSEDLYHFGLKIIPQIGLVDKSSKTLNFISTINLIGELKNRDDRGTVLDITLLYSKLSCYFPCLLCNGNHVTMCHEHK